MEDLNQRKNGQRIGLYGGAFDPVHHAHLALARRALQDGSLDIVTFIPAAQSPLKSTGPCVSDSERLAMLQLGIAGEPAFTVDPHELERGGISYSVETARHFRRKTPDAELFWILGADQFELLHRWRDVEVLASLVSFLVFGRPGSRVGDSPVAGLRHVLIEAPEMTESSSEIRDRCRSGESIAGLVPPAIEAFISERDLYTKQS